MDISSAVPTTIPQWQQLALYAIGAAVLITLLQRIPYVGRIIRLGFSLALLAFLIFIILQQAPYQPELGRFTQRLGLDDQRVVGRELRVAMAPDGHFWVLASINGVKTRMLIDSGATVTAISEETARSAQVDTGRGLTPVMLRTANGVAPAETGSIDELIPTQERAIRLSPRDHFLALYYGSACLAQYVGRNYEEAIRLARISVRLRNDYAGAHRVLTAATGMSGDADAAAAALQELRRAQPNISLAWVESHVPIQHADDLEHYLEGFRRAGLD